MKYLAGLMIAGVFVCADVLAETNPGTRYDVVIYGGTSAGVAAAVQVKRLGKSVALIEPTRRLGGLTTGGLGQTDIGNKAAIGGIAREFYQRVRQYYAQPAHWKWQKAPDYADNGQTRTAKAEAAMWTFEPHAAERSSTTWCARPVSTCSTPSGSIAAWAWRKRVYDRGHHDGVGPHLPPGGSSSMPPTKAT